MDDSTRPDRLRAMQGAPSDASVSSTDFDSVLFASEQDRYQAADAPDCFTDLNCDQIVEAVTADRDEYDLKPFFFAPLQRLEAIEYRQAVMRDLEDPALFERVQAFAQMMRDMRSYLGRVAKLSYKEQRQAWFLDAVESYCQSIRAFADDLSGAALNSNGLIGFRDYLTAYARSAPFTALETETRKLKADLAGIRYSVLIKGSRFTVRRYADEADYSAAVERSFAKFAQDAGKDYRARYRPTEEMNHIEAKILEFVAKLYPQVFGALDDYCTRNTHYLDETIASFDREIQFYLSYLDHIAPLKRAGLPFCYPRLTTDDKEIAVTEGFDLALARKLVGEEARVVCNDFFLRGAERILVVSGPNQGGKTTFARMVGQLHYLARLGCPVPGRDARLFLCDRVLTQFEQQEKVENLRGKLEDDLIRIHGLLDSASARSLIILNEVLTSTTLHDEIFLSGKVMEQVIGRDALCVWVTFLDELASFAPQTVSMVSTVAPDNPALRTFKIVRRPADGLAYAMAIAQKYRLSYAAIKERIQS